MEAFNFYGENVANFYRHFDEFKTQARYFLTPLPFEVKYVLSTAERKSHPSGFCFFNCCPYICIVG